MPRIVAEQRPLNIARVNFDLPLKLQRIRVTENTCAGVYAVTASLGMVRTAGALRQPSSPDEARRREADALGGEAVSNSR
jgi:hypothetical protein